MSECSPRFFSSRERAFIVMPAGCGKTQLIAEAIACHNEGRQLILTHTHAGVRVLRDRLRSLHIPPSRYRIDTIAGFALRYSASYPNLSGLGEFDPWVDPQWERVYDAGLQVLSQSVGKAVIRSSYAGLYVDEYQDCTQRQHQLIVKLAELMPCRIVGDPLQGIFGFGEDALVHWTQDVIPNFERLPHDETPWRWITRNEDLGAWLLEVRRCILGGQPFEIPTRVQGIRWIQRDHRAYIGTCLALAKKKGDSIVAICQWPHQAHSVAKNLKGTFSSMEEVESKDLLEWAAKLEQCRGQLRATTAIDFACKCMTKISVELKTVRKKLECAEQQVARKFKHGEIYHDLQEAAKTDDLHPVAHAFQLIQQIPGPVLYRRELWLDMQRAIREYNTGEYGSLREAAWHVRNRDRVFGRRVDQRTVSRTLLIKGLEFDHAIVIDADQLDAKSFYVAVTRGSKSVTIISSSRKITMKRPDNAIA